MQKIGWAWNLNKLQKKKSLIFELNLLKVDEWLKVFSLFSVSQHFKRGNLIQILK